MNNKKKLIGISLLTVLVYTAAIVWWHVYTPHSDFEMQMPGADNRPEGMERTIQTVHIGAFFHRFVEDYTSPLTGQWTTFRGENHDNIVNTPATITIPENGFPVLWYFTTGEGYAAPVIFNGKVYILDYDEDIRADMLRVFSLTTGQELWRRWYPMQLRRNHGFSRTVPVISEDFVITLGPMGHVMACHPITGDLLWTLNMEIEFDTEMPSWYAGQCPIVYNGVLILAPAGEEVLMAGLNPITGEILWTVPNDMGIRKSHSSIMPMTFHGKRMFVYFGEGGIVGVSAEEYDMGTLLWSSNLAPWHPTFQVSPTPIQISPTDMLLTTGYGQGTGRLRVNRTGNQWSVNLVEQWGTRDGLSSEQQTPILHNNMIITINTRDARADLRRRLSMFALNDLRTPVWLSEERICYGPFIVINDYLFVFEDFGELLVYRIGNRNMTLVKRQMVVPDGFDAWGPIAYADGIIIVGDAYNVKALRIAYYE